MYKIQPFMNNIKTEIRTISESAAQYSKVGARASRMYNLSGAQTKRLINKCRISGVLKAFMSRMCNMSNSLALLSDTTGIISRNMKKAVIKSKADNPNASKMKAKIAGLKESMPDVKEALKELGGINDVEAAAKTGGLMRGTIEAGKATIRTATYAGMAAAGTMVPIPGATIAFWIAGEKLANAVIGKPFTKQPKNIAKIAKKMQGG